MIIFAISSALIFTIISIGENESVKTISELLVFLITVFGSAFLALHLRLVKRRDYKER
jgi:hypothetical protein